MSFVETEEDFRELEYDTASLKKSKNGDGSSNTTSIFVAEHKISRKQRGSVLDHDGKFRGCIVWLTGLSGAGKSTIAMGVEKFLVARGFPSYCLDGDNVRAGLNKGLGFSLEDRKENIRRTAEAAVLMADAGQIVLCSLVSPTIEDRTNARVISNAKGLNFFEMYVSTPLEECERRDTKGLYRKCREGKLKGLTGIDQAYEEPKYPELILNTVNQAIETTVNKVIDFLKSKGVLPQVMPPPKFNGKMHQGAEELFVDPGSKESMISEIQSLVPVRLTTLDLQWLQILSEGWAAPLRGFMREDEYIKSLQHKVLRHGNELVNQSVPIVLAISDEEKNNIEGKDAIALHYEGNPVAILRKIEVFPHRKEERIARTFATSHPDHPYIKMINESGEWLVGGDLEVLERIKWNDGLDQYRLTPRELQMEYQRLGADVVYAFQLRNPVHNGHALLMNDCEQQLRAKGFKKPLLLLHPLGGWTKDDDVPLNVRMMQHKAILEEGVLDPRSTILAIFPSPMMYAGPTEVQWHAKARLNAGANFYIVGRDPAGIPHPDKTKGDLYDPTHGGRILEMKLGLEKLNIIKFRVAAYDKKHGKMAFFEPARSQDFEFISGTKMRTLARNHQNPPDGFMAPKAWQVLAQHYQDQVNGTN